MPSPSLLADRVLVQWPAVFSNLLVVPLAIFSINIPDLIVLTMYWTGAGVRFGTNKSFVWKNRMQEGVSACRFS